MGGIGRTWNEKDLQSFIRLWPELPMSELISKFGRTYSSLYDKAKKLGIRDLRPKDKAGQSTKGDLSVLLDGSLKSWYWLGFLCSDGHITKDGQLVLALSEMEPVKAFAKYVGSNVNSYKYGKTFQHRVSVRQPKVVLEIRELLGYQDQKTENPPTRIVELHGESLLAFFVGFIDGDGSIQLYRGDHPMLRCEVYESWLGVLEYLEKEVLKILKYSGASRVKINPRGYAQLCWGGRSFLISLSKEVEKLKLPLMKRKWSKLFLLWNV